MGLKFQPTWLLSFPYGVLKVVEFIVGLIILICVSVADINLSGNGFVKFVATGSLVSALILIVFYIINLPETVTFLPWNVMQIAICGFWAVCYVIAMGVAAHLASKGKNYYGNTHSCYTAAAIFCVVALIACGIETWGFWGRYMLARAQRSNQTQAEMKSTSAP